MTWGNRDDDALDALLVSPGRRGATHQAEIESLLTAGYARALELEAERMRLIDQMKPTDLVESVSVRLASLRDRLDEANRRHGGSRQRQFDRRPGTERGTDPKLAP